MNTQVKKFSVEDQIEFEGDDPSSFAAIHIWLFGGDGAKKPVTNLNLGGNGEATDWRNLMEVMADYCSSGKAQVGAKDESPLAAFWRFKDPKGRCVAANAAAMTLLVLDYDGLATYDSVLADLRQRGYAFFMHSTFSSAHCTVPGKRGSSARAADKGGADRFRVLIPLSREILVSEITGVFRTVVESEFRGIDRTCLAIAKRFYLPSAGRGIKVRFDKCKGRAYDVARAIDSAQKRETEERVFIERLKVDDPKDETKSRGNRSGQLESEDSSEWYCTALNALGIFRDKGWYRSAKGDGWHYVECPEGHLHSDGDPAAQLRATEGSAYFTFKCHHNHGGESHDTTWLNKWLFDTQQKDYLDRFRIKVPRKKEDLDRDFPGYVIRLNERYLADRKQGCLLVELDGDHGISSPSESQPKFSAEGARTLFLRSPKGTGKTDVINALVGKYESVICITHRISLAGELCRRVGLDSYQDSIESSRLGICMNSLGKLEKNRNVRDYDVVFIDESEQAFSHLAGATLKGNRLAVLSVFRHLVARAKLVICADADLSLQLSVKSILAIRGSGDAVFVDNTVNMGGRYFFYRRRIDIITTFFDDVFANPERRYWFATNAKANVAAPLYRLANEAGIRSLLVTADTAKTEDVQAFLASPAAYIRENDIRIVFASPVISTGFNLDEEGLIYRVYGAFGAGSFTAQDCDQAMHRVRHVESRHIFVKQRKPYDLAQVSKEARAKHDELLKHSNNSFKSYQDVGHLERLKAFESDHAELVYDVALHEARYQFGREAYLVHHYKDMGAEVNKFDSPLHDEDVIREMTNIVRRSTERGLADEIMKILRAENIDENECRRISASLTKSDDERCAEMKFLLSTSLKKSPNDLTESDVRGGWDDVERYRNIRNVIGDQDRLSEKDRKELVDGILALDRRNYRKKSDILIALLAESDTSLSRIIDSCTRYVASASRFASSTKGLGKTSNQFKMARKAFNIDVEKMSIAIDRNQVEATVQLIRRNPVLVNALLGTSFRFPDGHDLTPQTKGKIIAVIYDSLAIKLRPVSGNGYEVDLDRTSRKMRGFGVI